MQKPVTHLSIGLSDILMSYHENPMLSTPKYSHRLPNSVSSYGQYSRDGLVGTTKTPTEAFVLIFGTPPTVPCLRILESRSESCSQPERQPASGARSRIGG
jgi:hypothetical protein